MLKLVQNRERPGAQPTQEDLVLASGKSASVELEDLGTSWGLLIFNDDLHVWVRDLSQLRPRYEQSDPRQSRSEPLDKVFLRPVIILGDWLAPLRKVAYCHTSLQWN
jgi:hypothetical protein